MSFPHSLRASGARRETSPFPTDFTAVSQILHLIRHHGIFLENSSGAVPRRLHTRGEVALCRATRCIWPQNEIGDLRGRHLRGVDQRQDRSTDSFAHRSEARPDPRKLSRPMKAGMIFARKTTWRSRLDLEYLDETSSRKVSARQRYDDGPRSTRPLRQFTVHGKERALVEEVGRATVNSTALPPAQNESRKADNPPLVDSPEPVPMVRPSPTPVSAAILAERFDPAERYGPK